MRLHSVFVVLGVVAGLLLAAGAGDAEAAADAHASQVANAYLAHWLAWHPEEASRLGDHEKDAVLPVLTRAARVAQATESARWRDSLAALLSPSLLLARTIDVRLALARAEDDVRALMVDRLPERDPDWALRRLEVALSVPLRGFYTSPCSRGVALRRRMRATPEYLRQARLSLETPSRICTEAAIERAGTLLALCRESLPIALMNCRESRVQADVAEADSLAVTALTEYRTFLRDDVLPRAVDELPRGRESHEAALAAAAGEPISVDSLLARARAELEGLGAGPRAAGSDGPIGVDSARVLLDSVRVVVAQSRAFPDSDDERIAISDAPAPPGAPVLTAAGPWDQRSTRVRLDFGSPRGFTSGALGRFPLVTREEAELTIAAEGIPGRGLFEIRESRMGIGRARQAFGNDVMADAWTRYIESWWSVRRPEAAAIHHARERERLARSIAEGMLRAENATIETAADWLLRSTSMDGLGARRAALDAAVAPRWLASTVARWRIEALRDQFARQSDGRFDEAAFHEMLLREGAIPAGWIPLAEAGAKRKR